MRYYTLFLFIILTNIVNAQVMLPAYQGLQARVVNAVAPTVTTTAVTLINDSTVTTGGNVTSTGGGSITARGVCWSYSTGPTTANNVTTNGTGSGAFTSNPALGPGATLYLRAYATNSAGTSYGAEVSFTTVAVVIAARYRGGYVAYICHSGDPEYSPTAQHGIVMAGSDQSAGIQWYNGAVLAISTTFAQGDGRQNTLNIVAAQGAGSYAAQLCNDLNFNGYSDWFLANHSELSNIFQANASALIAAPGFTNFAPAYYWTSSNSNNTTSAVAFAVISNPVIRSYPEDQSKAVRAVRSF